MAENPEASPVVEQVGGLAETIAQKADKIKYLILTVLVAVIVIALLVSQQRKSSARREAQAKDKVFESMTRVALDYGGAAPNAAETFAKTAKELEGTAAGALARFLQFDFAYNENKDYPAAEQALQDFIKAYPQSPMLDRARLAIGQVRLQRGNVDGAISMFRDVAGKNNPQTLPEAKLALAQALERKAEEFRDDREEYLSRLAEAEAEYTDILSRAQSSIPSQGGFWAQSVTLPADFALVQIKDRMAGHAPGTPTSLRPPVAAPVDAANMPAPPAAANEILVDAASLTPGMDLQGILDGVRPDSEAPKSVDEAVDNAAESVKDSAVEAVSEAAEVVADTAAEAVDAAVRSGAASASEIASDAKEAASEAAETVAGQADTAAEAVDTAVRSGAASASEIASDAKEAASEAAEIVADQADTAAEAVDTAVRSGADTASDTASEIASDAKEAVSEAADAVADTVDSVAESARKAVEDAVDATGEEGDK